MSYPRKAVIFNELPSLSSYIIIYKKIFKIKKITKNKKNRESGPFRGPISFPFFFIMIEIYQFD